LQRIIEIYDSVANTARGAGSRDAGESSELTLFDFPPSPREGRGQG
jgi:hypothetical protein